MKNCVMLGGHGLPRIGRLTNRMMIERQVAATPSGTCSATRAARLRFAPRRVSIQKMPGVSRPQTYQRGIENDSATLHGTLGFSSTIWLAKNTDMPVQNTAAQNAGRSVRANRERSGAETSADDAPLTSS